MKNKFKTISTVSLLTLLTACGVVDSDERGVFVNNFTGSVSGPVEPGTHFYNPFSSDLNTLRVEEDKWNNETQAYTSDFQNASIQYTVVYKLDPKRVKDVWISSRDTWADKFIPAAVESSLKEVIGRTNATNIIQNRQVAQNEIKIKINERLRAVGIMITDFSIRNVDFSDAFEKAVEQKQTAVEEAQAAKNYTVKVQEVAKQKIITAEADAEAMRIKSQALAQNPGLAEYEAVLAWKETGGKVPTYLVVSGKGGPIPFLPIGQ